MPIRVTKYGDASKKLREIRRNLIERDAMLQDIGSAMADHARNSIHTSTDADTGEPFPPLAASTLRKPRISPLPLIRTGDLLDSIQARAPRGDSVTVEHLGYGKYHNQNIPGSGKIPRRRFVARDMMQSVAGLAKIVTTWVGKTLAGQTYRIGDGN